MEQNLINWLKEHCQDSENISVKEIKYSFPEIFETEDEKIQKFLVQLISSMSWRKDWKISQPECLSWLKNIPTDNEMLRTLHLEYEKGKQEVLEGQKPAEWSEDERIRNEILEYFTITHVQDFVANPERQKWISYIEKQKEPKPSIFPPGLGEVHFNPILCEQKEQKHSIEVTLNDIAPFEKEFRQLCGAYNIKLPFGKPFDVHHLCEDLLKFLKQKEQKPAEINNPLYGTTEEYYREAYYDEQKPVEWSQNENKDFGDCLTEMACELYECYLKSPENAAFAESKILDKWEPVLLKKAQKKL